MCETVPVGFQESEHGAAGRRRQDLKLEVEVSFALCFFCGTRDQSFEMGIFEGRHAATGGIPDSSIPIERPKGYLP